MTTKFEENNIGAKSQKEDGQEHIAMRLPWYEQTTEYIMKQEGYICLVA